MRQSIFIFLISSFIFLAALSSPAETLVGELPGDINVDNTGAASYIIPVSLPPGTAGMQPSLSIQYSSQGGNGIMGLGFSLSGLSAVSRAPATKLHDGVIDGVDFDELDRFVMDGQRLMVIPTNAVYGADGTQYRTEIDSFAKITLHGDMNSDNSWFEVHTKSGLIYEYGHTADSFVEPEGRTNALSWAVSKISDTVGNYMLFQYSENAGEPHLLTNIVYTGNDSQSLSPYNQVRFVYENRNDERTGYIAGSKFYATKRLQKIVIEGPSETVSEYHFNYEYNEVGLSTVTSIQQVFGDDTLPETVFEYSQKTEEDFFGYTSGTNFIPEGAANNVWRDTTPNRIFTGDFNGDGVFDMIRLDSNNDSKYSWIALANGDGTFEYTSGTNFISVGTSTNVYRSGSMQTLMPDFTGDGISDIVSIDPGNTSGKSWIGIANGDGTFHYLNGTNFIPDGDLDYVYRNINTEVMHGDFNGDGRADLVSVHQNPDASYSWIGLSEGNGAFTYLSGTNFIPDGSADNVYRDVYVQVNTGDFNGDGLTDLVSVYPGNDASKSWLGLSLGDGTFNYISGTNFIPDGDLDAVYRNINTRAFFGDVNGDGLSDLISVHQSSNASYSWIGLSRGDGTFHYISGTDFIPDGDLDNVYRDSSSNPFAADINGDGLADIVSIYPSTDASKSWVGLSNGDGTFTYINGTDFIPDGADGDVYRGVSTTVQLGDFNGDGTLDIASVYPDNTAGHSWIALNTGRHGFLNKVTKGYRSESLHGPVTEVEYLPITDNSIYEKGTGAEYPVYDVQSPMYVVSFLTKDNGIGGKYYSDYTYGEARAHRDRGFLGFRIFESYDWQTHLGQTEILEQAFPWTGSQISSETYYFPDGNSSTNRQLIKEVRNIWLYDTVQNGTLFPYTAKSVEKKWELGETDTNNTISEVTSYNWFDDQSTAGDAPNLTQATNNLPQDIVYGNIIKIVMDYGNGAQQISSNCYFDVNTNTWLLGRLSTSTVTHVLSGEPSITKTSSYYYNGTTGLLLQERIEPGHPTLEQTTWYDYDTFGNITNKTLYAPGVVSRSVQQSTYDANGRFVTESRNALNHSETYTYNQNTGLTLSQTGPNNLTTSWEYDPLGRKILETRADGTTTAVQYEWDRFVTVSATDPANPGNTLSQTSSYKITTQSSGSAPGTVWYDRQGREIRKQALSPSGKKKIRQDTVYNGLGQVVAVSENHFAGDSFKVGTSEYDALGRKQYVTVPDGTVTEYVYSGLTNQVIADSDHRTTDLIENPPKNQVKTTVQNAQGQTLRVIDNLGNTLTYEYDAAGNLVRTIDPNDNIVEMAYDIRGNKTAQDDPDMGSWSYTYNAIGELISQTDACSNRIDTAYDLLGRMASRTNWAMSVTNGLQLESTSAWFYDGTDEGCWLGSLRREELRDAQGELTYRKTVAYDELGRPMLELSGIDNKWYYSCVRYDQYSRVKFTDRFWRPKNKQGPEYNLDPDWNAFTLVNTYNNNGIVTKVTDSTGHEWWKIDDRDFDAKGHLLEYTLGNDTITSKIYDQDTGYLEQITCQNGSSATVDIQNDLYDLDRLGNLKSRQNLKQVLLRETFTYDNLNRLTQSTVESSLTNSTVSTVSYNAIGNILSKTGAGDYTYGSSKPHAVTQVTDNGSPITAYSYDANGNMVSRSVGGSNTLTTIWTSFNKPKTMFDGQNGSTFTYDINNNRITQIIENNGTVKKKLYIAGMEQDEEATNPEADEGSWNWEHKQTRIFINTPSGTVGIHVQDGDDTVTRKYFHTDHLGSIVAVTGEKVGDTAPILAEYSYDVWGKLRNPSDWSPTTGSQQLTTDTAASRGFTGHEMLDHLGLIHMNGRIYDATLGRFLSADPTVQFPGNLQSYNRYSYVGNNPLRYVDPSGYSWLSGAWKKYVDFHKKYWKTIVVICLAVVTLGAALAVLAIPGVSHAVFGNKFAEKSLSILRSISLIYQLFQRVEELQPLIPYVGMAISIALMCVGVPAPIAMAIGNMTVAFLSGGTLEDIYVAGAVAYISGTVAPGVSNNKIIQGAVTGAISDGATAAYYGEDPGEAALKGAIRGAAIASGKVALDEAATYYKSHVGFVANPLPGKNLPGGTAYNSVNGQQPMWTRALNVLGLNKPITGPSWVPKNYQWLLPNNFLKQTGMLSRTLNLVPTLNATASFHDYLFFKDGVNMNFSLLNNVGMMVPAAAVGAGACLGNYTQGINVNVLAAGIR